LRSASPKRPGGLNPVYFACRELGAIASGFGVAVYPNGIVDSGLKTTGLRKFVRAFVINRSTSRLVLVHAPPFHLPDVRLLIWLHDLSPLLEANAHPAIQAKGTVQIGQAPPRLGPRFARGQLFRVSVSANAMNRPQCGLRIHGLRFGIYSAAPYWLKLQN
jgi:hypothetical protein